MRTRIGRGYVHDIQECTWFVHDICTVYIEDIFRNIQSVQMVIEGDTGGYTEGLKRI